MFALLCSTATLIVADGAFARTQRAPENPVEFTIPAQTVPAALSAFARQANTQFLFIVDGFESVRANAVFGHYPTQKALDLLLAGTGLVAVYSPESGIKVTPVKAAAASESTGDGDAGEQGYIEAPRLLEDGARALEEIAVTGSRIRGARNASPIVTVTRQQIDRAGFATVEELIDKLPQNFGGGASLDTLTDTDNDTNVVGGNVGNEAGGTSVNLRGLGTSSTLILLNGRRLSPGGFSANFTNISSIPVTAIERIEVLTDGASAIYGSDAIGGVVNFILRDRYEGAETRLRYGVSGRGDTSNVLFGQAFGNSWDDGSVLLTYEYYDSANLANSDRDFTSTNDLRQFGGTDLRAAGGNPANINAAGQLWAIPAGQDGRSLTTADFPLDASGLPAALPNRYNNRSLADVLPGIERHSALLHLGQVIGSTEWFADTRFSTQKIRWRRNLTPIDIDVSDANPFFVDPTGTGLTTVTVAGYSLDNELGPQINSGEIDTSGVVLGLRFDMGENWRGELSGNRAKEEQHTATNLTVDLDALDAAVNPVGPNPDPERVFNPFGDGSNTSPAVIETFIDRSPDRLSETDNEIRSINLNVDGKGFELPGGAIQIAAGTEFRKENLLTTNNFRSTGDVTSDLGRDITSVYAEVFLPLVGNSNARPGLQRLEVSLAGRYENYSDFGDSVNPKAGIVWSPAQSLTVRGTYGASFRAPALLDLDVTRRSANFSSYFPQSLVDAGAVPFPMIARAGNSADLQPEKATTWTAGLQWVPVSVEALTLDVTYFNVDFSDRIALPITDFANADDPRFMSLVNFSPTLGEIAALVNDPTWLNPSGVSEADLLSGAAPVAIVDGRLGNVSRTVVTGVELQLEYRFRTVSGFVNAGLNGSYMFDFERALLDSDPLLDEVDTYGRPVDFRARAYMSWSRNAWSVSGFVNYTDGYTDGISHPARSVDSWSTADLSIVYATGAGGDYLANTRLSLTIQNLFDSDPPFINTPAGLAYNSHNADPQGLLLAFQITKQW